MIASAQKYQGIHSAQKAAQSRANKKGHAVAIKRHRMRDMVDTYSLDRYRGQDAYRIVRPFDPEALVHQLWSEHRTPKPDALDLSSIKTASDVRDAGGRVQITKGRGKHAGTTYHRFHFDCPVLLDGTIYKSASTGPTPKGKQPTWKRGLRHGWQKFENRTEEMADDMHTERTHRIFLLAVHGLSENGDERAATQLLDRTGILFWLSIHQLLRGEPDNPMQMKWLNTTTRLAQAFDWDTSRFGSIDDVTKELRRMDAEITPTMQSQLEARFLNQ